ncbi:MAG: hypothetical protein EOP45_17765 [Sphingobacteriaceae bacterium]|nr:MAG: hypothetical protein EOP45_17765 [Sphingobacteriaceae bacterium]
MVNKFNIIVYAGAGSSVPSGIPAFTKGDNALWNNYDVDQVCNIKTFKNNMSVIHKFYRDFFIMEKACRPHLFHTWLKEKEEDGHDIQIVTTNIDSLFERAGLTKVNHVHGSLEFQKCIGCGTKWTINREQETILPRCPKCDCQYTKPDVIFRNEKCVKEYTTGNTLLRKYCKQTSSILIDVG